MSQNLSSAAVVIGTLRVNVDQTWYFMHKVQGSVPTQNLNWGFSYPLILKLEGMK